MLCHQAPVLRELVVVLTPRTQLDDPNDGLGVLFADQVLQEHIHHVLPCYPGSSLVRLSPAQT